MHLECSFDGEEADVVLVIFLPQVLLLACEIISWFPLQVHQEPHIVPHIMVLLDMHLEVDIQSIEVLSVYITNKASIFSVMMDFLV